MLIFQNFIFWASLFLFFNKRASSVFLNAALILVVGFWPSNFILMGTIWKDSLMGALLLLASAALSCLHRDAKSKGYLILLSTALMATIFLRHNAIIAVIPFLIYLLWTKHSRLVVFSILAGPLFFSQFINAEKMYPIQQIFFHDLAAISIRTETNYFSQLTGKQNQSLSLADLKKIYTPDGVVPLVCCGPEADQKYVQFTNKPDELENVRSTWVHAILEQPRAYFRHRIKVFNELLGVYRSSVCAPFHRGIDANTEGFSLKNNLLFDRVLSFYDWFRDSFLLRGWFYFLLAAACLLYLLKQKQKNYFSLTLLSSALLYGISYVFIATTCDFRLIHWLTLATIVASIETIPGMIEKKTKANLNASS